MCDLNVGVYPTAYDMGFRFRQWQCLLHDGKVSLELYMGSVDKVDCYVHVLQRTNLIGCKL